MDKHFGRFFIKMLTFLCKGIDVFISLFRCVSDVFSLVGCCVSVLGSEFVQLFFVVFSPLFISQKMLQMHKTG